MAVIEGTAYWNNITTPNTKFEHVYSTNLVVPDDVAAKFKAEGYSVKEMDEGQALVIKRKVAKKGGGTNPAPKLIDKDMQPLDAQVGNGSRVVVQYHPWESTNSYGHFKGLDLQAMQVLELVEFSGSTADGEELGYVEAGDPTDEL
jgi:hypothetical protein